MNPVDLQERIGPRTRLVWLETPGSVTMEFVPLAELAAICRGRGVTTALDNTWAGGIALNGFDLGRGERRVQGSGADVVVHALTKYPSGGGDVLMGAMVTRNDALHLKLKLTHMRVGWGVAGNDAEAILRSLPSLPLRYRAHDVAARSLAAWLRKRDEIASLLHPAFEGSPGHEHWRELCGEDGAAAGLFSVVFHERYSAAQVDAFCDSLVLFKLGYSWGGPLSLVVPYDVSSMRNARLGCWKHKGTLVRFSVGLEDVDDLRADIEQALKALE
jgi:cysteine-S-conjugate beta-lyase